MRTIKIIIFVLASAGIIWVSIPSLRDSRSHGFYRFFAWETILVVFLLNVNYWFVEPFSLHQLIAWPLLVISLILIIHAVWLFRVTGQIDKQREDPSLVGIEKTTQLVTRGAYRYIRHPFYSSLLFLAWGIFFKHPSWAGGAMALVATVFLSITAKIEEAENIQFFGSEYQSYMQKTKMFIPYIF
jgi:protein-S-isoprenylcysteine O-methyltransferase Ste14